MAQKLAASLERRSQDHARGSTLRPDFTGGTETRPGGRRFTPSCRSSAWQRRRLISFINSTPRKIPTSRFISAARRRWKRSRSAPNGKSDVVLRSLAGNDRLLAFRYHDLILLKNYSAQPVSVRGRPLVRGGFCRIYPGQRVLIGDDVLSFQDLATYFNAKKNVSLPQIFVRVNQGLRRGRTGTLADTRKFARSHFRPEGEGQGAPRCPGDAQRRQASRPARRSKHRSTTASSSTTTPSWIFPICGAGRERWAADFSSRPRNRNILFRITRVCSRQTTSCCRRERAGDVAAENLLRLRQTSRRSRSVLSRTGRSWSATRAVRTTAPLADGDTIRIDVGQFLRCDFSERIIEEERNIIRTLEVVDVNHRFQQQRGCDSKASALLSIAASSSA